MKKSKQSKEPICAHTMLQVRVLFRDQDGQVSDVTQSENEYGFGLKSLVWRSACVEDGLLRITELLKVLALAAESRTTVDATLVQRILEEVGETLDDSAEMPAYIRHTRELFEEAEALPPLDEAEMRKAFGSLALAS